MVSSGRRSRGESVSSASHTATSNPARGELSKPVRVAADFVRRSWTGLVVALVAVALGVAAFLVPGLSQAEVRLNLGSVFVMRQDGARIGVVNAQIDELADSTDVGDTQFRVLQSADGVLVQGLLSSTLARYDAATNQVDTPLRLPANSRVALGAANVAVVNTENGRVWFGPIDDVLRVNFDVDKARFEVGENGLVTFDSADQIIGLDISANTLLRLQPDGTTTEVAVPIDIDEQDANVQLSAVGTKAVVLDRSTQRIWVEGMSKAFDVSGGNTAELAAPASSALNGENGAKAFYATQAGLIAVTNDGPRSVSGALNGTPVAPVTRGDCVYGVNGSTFVRKCIGKDPYTATIPELPSGANLTFQVNRDTVALNDQQSGYVWLVDKDMTLIKDWTRTIPPVVSDPTTTDTTTTTLPERTEVNTAPVARDDNLAARAGRSTVLPVLDNDSDADGDVLTILGPPTVSGGATLELIRGGAGLQVTIPAGVTGTLNFNYTISDGREGGTSSARVTVKVLPAEQSQSNEPPHISPTAQTMVMQSDSTATKRVLLDWRDRDGDDLILLKAWREDGSEDDVSYTVDGQVTFTDVGKTTGAKRVHLLVSDGVAETEGVLNIEVEKDRVPPIAYGDFVSTSVGTEEVIRPLDNDFGRNLTLASVGESTDAYTVVPNYREGSFSFKATKPGTYYVTYKVSNGDVALGLVRVDVVARTENRKPVAARDVALLTPGGEVLVDPLLNDTDPDGDVLVVQSISQDPRLKVVLERRHLVTISAVHLPDEPISLTYWVSDGHESVPGTLVVMPAPSSPEVRPVAKNDAVKVRAGAITSIDVLANDASPIGLPLSVSKLTKNPLKDRAWISQGKVWVSVPKGAQDSNLSIFYEAADVEGRFDTGTATVTVVSEDSPNEPPAPPVVIDRVLAGSTTRIAVPLAQADPNGDAVRLLGLGSGPNLGRVMAIGDGWISYEAYPGSKGTDVFSYRVIDSLGAVGVGEIRIGVAPPSDNNSEPTAMPDEISVRPGRQAQLPVLANDYDIDGDSIGLVGGDNAVELKGIEATIVNDANVSFTAPSAPGTYTGKYYIQDARGKSANGNITIQVDPEAPLLPPVARDDLVPVNTVIGKDYIEVDVLANDYDPDGAHSELQVSLPDEVTDERKPAVLSNGRVQVPVADDMQQVRYRVTDADGESAIAVIVVPGRNDSVPVLKDPGLHLEVTAGETLRMTLNELIVGTRGRLVKLASVDTLKYSNARVTPASDMVQMVPDLTFAGPTSVVFEVTDIVPAGDKTAKRAFVSIPIKVLPAPSAKKGGDQDADNLNHAPRQRGTETPTLLIAPGEDANRIDLMGEYFDPDGDKFRFENFSEVTSAAGITWSVGSDPSKITASAGPTVKPGTEMKLRGTAIDSVGARNPDVFVIIRVTNSTRPLASTANDVIPDANDGLPSSIDPTKNDKSYFDPPTLTVVSAPSVSGAQVSVSNNVVTVVPDKGFHGELTVRYTVEDATRDPNRRVDGFIRVTVRAAPSQPGVPREGVPDDGQVTIKWTGANDNGLPITRREVTPRSPSGTLKPQQCESTTCTITGLQNAVPWTFSVVEYNDRGPSPASGMSAPYIPDVVPGKPPAPVITGFGNGQLTVTWAAGENRGSKIRLWTLTILSDTGSDSKVLRAEDGTSTTWGGLTNGVAYRFKVSATNDRGPSLESEFSAPEVPAAPPSAPTAVDASDTDALLGREAVITWNPNVETNGAPVTAWWVTRYAGNSSRTFIYEDRNLSSVTMTDLENNVDYTFDVQAYNKAGPSANSVRSRVVRAFGAPSVPANVQAVTYSGEVGVVSGASAENGRPIDKYIAHLRPLGSSVVATASGSSLPIRMSATNGVSYQILLQACSAGKCSALSEPSNIVLPLGEPAAPVVRDFFAESQSVYWVELARGASDSAGNGGHALSSTSYYYDNTGGSSFNDSLALNEGSRLVRVANSSLVVRAKAVANGKDSAVTEKTFQPPLTVSVSGAKLVSFRLANLNSEVGQVTCVLGRRAQFSTVSTSGRGASGTFELPAEPGSYTVSCDAGRQPNRWGGFDLSVIEAQVDVP